jgi:hypothetical protein
LAKNCKLQFFQHSRGFSFQRRHFEQGNFEATCGARTSWGGRAKRTKTMLLETPICDFGWQAPDFNLKNPDGWRYPITVDNF